MAAARCSALNPLAWLKACFDIVDTTVGLVSVEGECSLVRIKVSHNLSQQSRLLGLTSETTRLKHTLFARPAVTSSLPPRTAVLLYVQI